MKNILTLFIALLQLTACENDERISIDEDFKRYFNCSENSWWVYEDTAQGIRDSLYVSNYKRFWEADGTKGLLFLLKIICSEKTITKKIIVQ